MLLEPRKALNKAFLKIKPNRTGIELFKSNLITLLNHAGKEREEFHKNLISDFLKNTYYSPHFFINTKDSKDLVIHTGKDAKSAVGVIIEAKSPSNKAEMISKNNLNSKALQELVLYFLRERILHKNLEIKHLVATNLNEWFIFDGQLFDKLFAQNKAFVKQFQDFESGNLSVTSTDFFYREMAKPFIETVVDKLEYTYFDLATYDKILRNDDKTDDAKLIVLYKLLSPEHLLKLSFANDSNSLDKNFYNELLHLIGLTETKEGGKKLIERPKAGLRQAGSLLENTIHQLDSLDKINRLPNAKQYGDTYDERLFTVALELCITWVNRILFLKLLEAQLISYHKGDKTYAFLHAGLLHDYDNLNALFFMVLAKKPEERNERVKTLFAQVPYLNSSLFEPTELEHQTLFISGLEDHVPLPYLSATVIKDANGKKKTGAEDALNYFFSFLDAYDFASEGSEDIQEDNKTLINASVLGLIFEKINGYKDGSFYTPGFITMYMCKETIRRAVLQKFNEVKGWDCTNFVALYNQDFTEKEANSIINSIKICDPAVGSGHFLVSALNEMIAIKHDLGVLVDKEGKKLKGYQIDIVNDELMVTDEDGLPFVYNPNNKESQRIQETLFHEKQTIIENCLFGVDINPNSVKICRLRLWIELLKNAYYRENREKKIENRQGGLENREKNIENRQSGLGFRELETLPNIDINIKCGNSLISRFGLEADLKKALKQSKWNMESYKLAVATYRNAENKEQKREMEQLIADIKGNFRSEIGINDPKKLKLEKLKGELFNYTQQVGLFERSKKEEAEWNKKVNTLSADVKQLETELEEIKSNKIYENAFEWRFEFPEVLNDLGDFVGFDVVIGNPPYVQLQSMKEMSKQYEKLNYQTYSSMGDLYALFYEKGNDILKQEGLLCFITGSAWMRANYGKQLRDYLKNKTKIIDLIDFSDCEIFDSATILTNVITLKKSNEKNKIKVIRFTRKDQNKLVDLEKIFNSEYIEINEFPETSWIIKEKLSFDIKSKIENQGTKLIDWKIKINRGIITGFNEAFIIDSETKNELVKKDFKNEELLKPLLRGRDIKKYYHDYQNLWLINVHNGIKEKGIKPIEINDYPTIKDYLDLYWDKLKIRFDQGNTPYNLRNCAYLEEFEYPKIIYSDISKLMPFTLDKEKYYTNDRCFFITGSDIEYLVCLLNSKLFKFCFESDFPELQGNSKKMIKVVFEQIPLKYISVKDQQPFITKVDEILAIKQSNPTADTSALEREIDFMVYGLYGLSEGEINIVENS
ncbi:Eco57I restriction-modification methylase domain-containing protein [Flavobacterium sp.]|jgi:type II restriction/modification system DNA methylase subunit YeeA|uniref:type IIG restriction enzyme/methyltransferase n=1 Tax=Flavobacterium sp. TaxID=239 RepID=UPI0037BE8507